VGTLAAPPISKQGTKRHTSASIPTLHREEPKELDSDNEAVAHMHEGIRRILSRASPKTGTGLDVPENEKHVLHCGKILKVEFERRIVNIIVEKSEGGLQQVRIEASED